MSLSSFTFIDLLNLFTLSASILGILLSFLLLFSLNLTKQLSLLINPLLNFKWSRLFNFLDKHIETDPFIFRHSFIFGLLITLSSSYVFFFFLMDFNLSLFLNSLSISSFYFPVLEPLVLLTLIMGSILLTLCFLSGLGMIFFPSAFQSFNSRLSRWISLESHEVKSTTIQKDTDTIFFLHSRLFGSILLLASLFLLGLSLLNLNLCEFSFKSLNIFS